MGYCIWGESRMGPKAEVSPLLTLPSLLPSEGTIWVCSHISPHPPPPPATLCPFLPSPFLDAEPLSPQPLTLTSPPCQTQQPLPLCSLLLLPPSSCGICRGLRDGLPDVRSRPQLFPGRGQEAGFQLGSTSTEGPGADCVALVGLPFGLQRWICSGRERARGRSLGPFPVPAPSVALSFLLLFLFFYQLLFFPNNPCREYVPSKGRRASLWPALVGDGTVLLYRC